MKVLFGLLLILSCVDRAFAKNNENRVATQIETLSLAMPDPQGLSHNDFNVKLKNNGYNKIVFIDLQFDAGNFKTMIAATPQVSAEDCKEPPEIAKWMPKKNAHEPMETYQRAYGWGEDLSAPIWTLFGLTEDVSKGGHQTITLWFSIASTCTKLHVQFDVQFVAKPLP